MDSQKERQGNVGPQSYAGQRGSWVESGSPFGDVFSGPDEIRGIRAVMTGFSALVLLFIAASMSILAQNPTPESRKAAEEWVANDTFRSKVARFEIALATMPQTLGVSPNPIHYNWMFFDKRVSYSVDYNPPFKYDHRRTTNELTLMPDVEANFPQMLSSITGSKPRLQRPLRLGKLRGTEYRFVSKDGGFCIARIFLVGGYDYQLIAFYRKESDEKEVLGVLDSFKIIGAR
ncbi:MAG: hypothetical protein ACJ73D_10945 [Pyrinomonadaceae bacterium]